MIRLENIEPWFPPFIKENPIHRKYMVKEYIQLMMLDFLATTSYIRKVVFIGGTCLRLVKGIDRFSEDLDFDCKDISPEEFIQMTDEVLVFLKRFGMNVEIRDKKNEKLKALRRNFYFPELLFDMGLSGYRDERFLIKIEAQDQMVSYRPELVNIKGCGFFFPFTVPDDRILCAMKISALLSRRKGRDFYDAMFLLGQTEPDYQFLAVRNGIADLTQLKQALEKILIETDLENKTRDFEHLLFEKRNSRRILGFSEFLNAEN